MVPKTNRTTAGMNLLIASGCTFYVELVRCHEVNEFSSYFRSALLAHWFETKNAVTKARLITALKIVRSCRYKVLKYSATSLASASVKF